jgi:thermitase
MKKIIVRFREDRPSTIQGLAEVNDSLPNLKRMYSFEPDVNSFLKKTKLNVASYASGEDLFVNELLPKKSEEEKKLFRTFTAEFETEVEAAAAIDKLKDDPNVEYVQLSNLNELYYVPDDPLFGELWGLTKINCTKAWDVAEGNEVIVAVIDSGVDYSHPDLSGNMWTSPSGKFGFDFSDGDDDPMDSHGHGSHVAGTIAAIGNNNQGVVGVAPKAKIMALKIFPNATDDVCAQAIKYAADNGASVINNSWGPTSRSPVNKALEEAVNYALSKGVVVIFAAGNKSDEVKYYSPANHPGVVCVGASDRKDNRCLFSNYGPEVTVSAPGENILSAKISGGYTYKSGTSMAAPHVSGLAALIVARFPHIAGTLVKTRIEQNTDRIFPDKPIGSGRINASNSLI